MRRKTYRFKAQKWQFQTLKLPLSEAKTIGFVLS